MHDGSTMLFAAIYRENSAGEKEYTILTRDSSDAEVVRPIHDRMPVIIPEHLHEVWLERGMGIEQAIRDVVLNDR